MMKIHQILVSITVVVGFCFFPCAVVAEESVDTTDSIVDVTIDDSYEIEDEQPAVSLEDETQASDASVIINSSVNTDSVDGFVIVNDSQNTESQIQPDSQSTSNDTSIDETPDTEDSIAEALPPAELLPESDSTSAYTINRIGWNQQPDGSWIWSPDAKTFVTGWKSISNRWYYFDLSDGRMRCNESFVVGGVTYVANSSGACPSGSWVYADGRWYLTNGSCAARSGWAKSGGTWYYLDPLTKQMKCNEAFVVGAVTYVANASGGCPASSWVKVDGSWYLTNGSCAARSGWAKSGGTWYYLDPQTKKMKCDEFFDVAGKTYAANASGACPANSWLKTSQGWLYTTQSCAVAKGWKSVRGTWYFFDKSSGLMYESRLFSVAGKTYYARGDGSCPANTWFELEGKWLRTDGSCALRTGWWNTGVTWYYFDPVDSSSATGVHEIDGKKYVFHSPMGGLASSEYVTLDDGSRVYANARGEVAKSGPTPSFSDKSGWARFDGEWYYIDKKTGVPLTGWIDDKGKRYWLDADGVMVTGTQLIDGKAYWFATSGELVKELNGTADDLINAALADVGYSVDADKQTGSKYGRWYNENANPWKGSVDYAADGVAYCVMAVSYWMNSANVGAPGFPRAGCEGAALYARKEGRAVAPNAITRGMLVLFDWDRDGEPDHIGIVTDRLSERSFKTVEGNTSRGIAGSQDNGGWVAARTRDIDDVFCGIKPYYF